MAPIPRARGRIVDDDGAGRMRTRLDFLIALMIVQIILSIGLWVDRRPTRSPETIETLSSPPPAASEKTSDKSILNDLSDSQEELSGQVSTEPEPPPVPETRAVRVQVLNGCGVKGVARKAQLWLIKNKFDVRNVGNADRQDYQRSLVLDRSGNLTAARDFAQIMGIAEANVNRHTGAPSSNYDLTLIIGKDYKRLIFDH
ncbi:MAG: LytR C-terminal domain-containing protein [Calditrichota bacterium]